MSVGEERDENAGLQAVEEGNRAAAEVRAARRRYRKRQIRKQYEERDRGIPGGWAESSRFVRPGSKGRSRPTGYSGHGGSGRQKRGRGLILAGIFLAALFLLASVASSCGLFFAGGMEMTSGASYTASDAEILNTEADYCKKEQALRRLAEEAEQHNPGYEEYRYELAEAGHDPYELAAWLTVQAEAYRRDEVQGLLENLLEAQYELTFTETTEVRETGDTTEEGEPEKRQVRVLTVRFRNRGIRAAAQLLGLTEEQEARYEVLMVTKGCREELFAGNIYASEARTYPDYRIPAEALTEERFARMIAEAETYLGYPYVWGGSEPATSFDCSGYVSWVINHCGNGWNVGRRTANGLLQICAVIPKSEAEPGDLIFFQGTYETAGASHVGIYVGDEMMIHCGNPISYTSIETAYWQEHFLCFGRIPEEE